MLGVLFYGYALGVFSSRLIKRHAHESIPCHFVASGLHPDHDTIAQLGKTFLSEIQSLFVQTLDHAGLLAVATWLSTYVDALRQLGHFIDAIYNRKHSPRRWAASARLRSKRSVGPNS